MVTTTPVPTKVSAAAAGRATGTTGEGAVTATANGLTCVVFDRARRRPRLTDRVQTVWTVFLPAPLPYVGASDVDGVRVGLTTEPPAPPAAQVLAGVPTPPVDWWIEGGYLYGVHESPARPELVAEGVELLTRFAATIPWQQLAHQA